MLRLSGDLVGNEFRFTGETVGRNGAKTLQHLTFSKNPDGTVRQYWEGSTDDGKSRSVVFDGPYRRR